MDRNPANSVGYAASRPGTPVVERARTILDWITRTRRQRFTRRELFTAVSRARFRKTTDLDAPLALLEQHGYLRRGPTHVTCGNLRGGTRRLLALDASR
ncbi:MAG: hypothetical protein LC799_24740 [Actinobacteria bacterium]|nr:hypothetical protein [Actinomycetota bacterium]